ncbi:MAG: SDR family NAD(P)-dependent oxidoreductase [Lachnospiraceae bacterium]|nr:SDR family NAD(P)-dependent oxidoreductase [Lachnospiraceae bacterium]
MKKRIVIITGASSGMGKEFAFLLDKKLNTINEFWLIGRNVEKLKEVKKIMRTNCKIFECDLNERTELKKVMKQLYHEQVEIKMLINCAGYGMMGKFEDISYNDNVGMIDVNCRALTSLTYDCIPFMAKNSRIINVASSGAFLPQPYFAVYCATKCYVLSFSRALNAELKDRDVYVTAVCPGPVDTAFFDRAETYGKKLEIKKYVMAKPKEVVVKAVRDSIYKKQISVYGPVMKAFNYATKVFPHKPFIDLIYYMQNMQK